MRCFILVQEASLSSIPDFLTGIEIKPYYLLLFTHYFLLNFMSIRVNRVLSKKQNIAGIPADIFLPVVAFDTVAMVFLCLCFGLPAIPIATCCLTINIVWAILVAKGVWR